jgi:signal transduction histidine kinase
LYIASNLIDYSSLVAEQFTISKTYAELNAIKQECEAMIKILADQKHLEFTIEVHKNCPQYIFTDQNRLKQILLNLLGNAVKYTKTGSIRLFVQPSLANHLNFMISDTGSGIPKEELPWLFNQFGTLSDRSLNPNG